MRDLDGRVLRMFGTAGRGPGELLYPYDVALLGDDTLLVAEFGNNRVQRLSLEDGTCRGLYGTLGNGPGELKTPWGVDVTEDHVVVLDSGNDRVQVVRKKTVKNPKRLKVPEPDGVEAVE